MEVVHFPADSAGGVQLHSDIFCEMSRDLD